MNSAASSTSYPVWLTATGPAPVARWRPLVHWILAIPHLIVLSVVELVAQVMALVAWFSGVFTGRISEGIQAPIAFSLRYAARVNAYALFMNETYPPFAWNMSMADPGDYPPLAVDVSPELEGRNRLTIFFRLILMLPAAIVLAFVSLAAFVVIGIAFFAVLITGKWPTGLYNFAVGFLRWTTRVSAYGYLLTDTYPPFSLD